MFKKFFKIRKIYKEHKWKSEEDEVLCYTFKNHTRNKWKILFKSLKNKTKNECISRFRFLCKNFKKGRWSLEEDDKLKNLVNLFGKNWKLISKIIKNRTNKQIRTRYSEYLDGKINQTKFTEEEDSILIKLYNNLKGFNNKLFQEKFPNYSIKALKNRLSQLEKLNKINSYKNFSDYFNNNSERMNIQQNFNFVLKYNNKENSINKKITDETSLFNQGINLSLILENL